MLRLALDEAARQRPGARDAECINDSAQYAVSHVHPQIHHTARSPNVGTSIEYDDRPHAHVTTIAASEPPAAKRAGSQCHGSPFPRSFDSGVRPFCGSWAARSFGEFVDAAARLASLDTKAGSGVVFTQLRGHSAEVARITSVCLTPRL